MPSQFHIAHKERTSRSMDTLVVALAVEVGFVGWASWRIRWARRWWEVSTSSRASHKAPAARVSNGLGGLGSCLSVVSSRLRSSVVSAVLRRLRCAELCNMYLACGFLETCITCNLCQAEFALSSQSRNASLPMVQKLDFCCWCFHVSEAVTVMDFLIEYLF